MLLRQRQLPSGYQYFLNFGISYPFGSIFNNIVNPRFGGVSRGVSADFTAAAARRSRDYRKTTTVAIAGLRHRE